MRKISFLFTSSLLAFFLTYCVASNATEFNDSYLRKGISSNAYGTSYINQGMVTPEPSPDYFTAIMSIISALLGAGIAGYFSNKATRDTLLEQRKRDEENERTLIYSTLCAIHAEMECVLARYMDSMGLRIEELPDNEPLLFYYPLSSDYFSVFNGNSSLIGRIKNENLRKQIIKTYILAKGVVDSYKLNNDLLINYERLTRLHEETNNPTHHEQAKYYYEGLVEYSGGIKFLHAQLVSEINVLLQEISNTQQVDC